MKAILLSGLVLLIFFFAFLVGGRRAEGTLGRTRQQAARVLPGETLQWSASKAQSYTARAFELVPSKMRPKAVRDSWSAVELVVFRGVLLWHMLPIFALPFGIGVLEGFSTRQSQRAVVKIHSPLRFRVSLLSLGLLPVGAVLWMAAPVAVPPSLMVFLLFCVAIWACRNLIVHAPTHF